MTTTETLDVISRRYSCRAYQDTAVPADLLRTIAEAGLHAPSAVNRQPWRLSVLTNREAMAQIDQAGLAALKASDEAGYARIQSRGGTLLYNAPAMIIVSAETGTSTFSPLMDAGIVVATMALAATSLGLASCIAAFPGLGFKGEAGQALRARYIPEGFEYAICLMVGYAAQADGSPHQPDPSKISYF